MNDPTYAMEKYGEPLCQAHYALRRYGKIQNMEEEQETCYDPWAITHKAQETALGYIDDTPVDEEGRNKWLVINKYRQAGISTTVADAFYCKAQFIPGWQHITSADKKDRADYLFERVNYLHTRWPEELREDFMPGASSATRQYRWQHGGSMLVQTGGSGGMGVGRSASSWHWSEIPLWSEASKQWTQLYPGIVHRKAAKFVFESTPFPLSEPSAAFYMDLCEQARQGKGRFLYAFFPFWDGKLNRRPFKKGEVLDNEEIRLLERYGRFGLTRENLMFRRETMASVADIKRNPDLFNVYYPFDDITCWMVGGGGVIKPRHLERHLTGLVDWEAGDTYKEYESPRPNSNYALVADPSGYGARDHASFHVFEIWSGSWRQVATYASQADPPEFIEMMLKVGRKFNWATINVERNGVGNGVIAALELADYPNLYWERSDRPGQHKRSEAQLLAPLIDALNETLELRDRDLVSQLRTYKADRALEKSVEAEILHEGPGKGRRGRHHWDKVSALMMLPAVAMSLPQRRAPFEMVDVSRTRQFNQLTLDQIHEYEARARALSSRRAKTKSNKGRRAFYKPLGRR